MSKSKLFLLLGALIAIDILLTPAELTDKIIVKNVSLLVVFSLGVYNLVDTIPQSNNIEIMFNAFKFLVLFCEPFIKDLLLSLFNPNKDVIKPQVQYQLFSTSEDDDICSPSIHQDEILVFSPESVTVQPNSIIECRSNLLLSIPSGYYGELHSPLKGLTILSTRHTPADKSKEVKVTFKNVSSTTMLIKHCDVLCTISLKKNEPFDFVNLLS